MPKSSRRATLPFRLLLATIAVSAVTAVGTVWLTATTQPTYDLSRAERNSEADSAIVAELLDWGASHPDWNQAAPLVNRLSHQYGRRVAIVSGDRVIVDTLRGAPHPDHARNPLDVWQGVLDAAYAAPEAKKDAPSLFASDTGAFPPGVIGPFALDEATQQRLLATATAIAACAGAPAEKPVEFWPNGRPILLADDERIAGCGGSELIEPTSSEQNALDRLATAVDRCLLESGAAPVRHLALDRVPSGENRIRFLVEEDDGSTRSLKTVTEQRCAATAAHTLAEPHIAPPVDVYLTDYRGDVRGPLDLSPGSTARIVAVAVGILALVLATAWFIGGPVVRRVRALSRAAHQLSTGDLSARVPVKGNDEITELAKSFNAMASGLMASREQQDRMIHDTAHELRTPLTNLRGWIEGAQDGVVSVDEELLAVLHSETTRLEQLAADLRTLTLAETGRLALHPREVDLAEVVVDAVRSAGATAEAAGVEFRMELSPCTLFADPLRLRQIVDNLVANSLQHSEGSTITMDLAPDPTGATATLTISDDGVGVSDDDLPHLFDRFWRADPARDRRTGGSGLGLAIVRQLVDAHGGGVAARRGTTGGLAVSVTLPTSRPQRPGEQSSGDDAAITSGGR